jgi:outer membrane lipoprotein-sorting protein
MKTVVLLFALTFAVPLAQAKAPNPPTVDEILARYAHAMGGKAEFEKVSTMVFRGTMEFPSYNLSGTTAEYFKAPDHFLTVTEIPGYGTLRTVYDGKSAWTEDPKQGVKDIVGPALTDMRRRADIQWHVKLKELYPGLKLKGRESIEGKEAWVLEVTQDGWTFDLCFDVDTGLMVRFDTNTGEPDGVSKVFIRDYRPVGNAQFSFAASMITTKVVWSRKLTEVKFNVPVDDALFLKASVGKDSDKG